MPAFPSRKGWTRKPPLGFGVNRGHPLAPDLVWLSLYNEGGGLRAYDAGSSRSLLIGPDTVWERTGINIRNSSTGMASPAGETFPYYPEFTVVVSLQRSAGSIGVDQRGIAAHHTQSGQPSDWFLWFATDNKLHVDIPWVAGHVFDGATAITDTASVHQIALVRRHPSNWAYTTYIDANLDATGTNGSNPVASPFKLCVGGFVDQMPLFGRLDYFALFNRALRLDEIRMLHANPYGLVMPSGARWQT